MLQENENVILPPYLGEKYNYSRKCHNNARNILKINTRDESIKFSKAQRAKLLFYGYEGRNRR
jgi:hypothetical protein